MLAAAVLAALLGAVSALATPAFWPVDELPHVAYADALAHGTLPEIETETPELPYPGQAARLGWERRELHLDRLTIWTANHPPLAHLLAAGPLRLGMALDSPQLALLGARLMSAAAAFAGVLATAWLARGLAPGRPRVELTAAALVAMVPGLVHVAGLVFTDALAFATATAVLAAGLHVLRHGPTPGLTAALAVLSALAAMTRVTNLAAVGAALAAAALGAWHAAAGPSRRRVRAAAAAVLPAVLLMAVCAGWFYLRNAQLYGSASATGYLLDKFDRAPNHTIPEVVFDPEHWIDQWDRLVTDLTSGVWTRGWRVLVGRALAILLLAGPLLALLRRARRPDTGPGRRPRRGRRAAIAVAGRPEVQAWVLALAVPAALVASATVFHAIGGSAHARYLLGGLGVLAILAALGLEATSRTLGGRDPAPAQRAALVLLAVLDGGMVVALLGPDVHAAWAGDHGATLVLPRLFAGSLLLPVVAGATVIAFAGVWEALAGPRRGGEPDSVITLDDPRERTPAR